MFKYYFLLSFAITIGAIYHSYQIHQQFYPTILYLSTNKINRTIFINFSLMLVSLFIITFIRITFGEVKEMEKIYVIEKTKRKILEVAYLLFFFTDELDWQFIFLMIGLIALSVVHWVTQKRAGYLIAESQMQFTKHAKIILCFLMLFYIDFKISLYFFQLKEDKFQDVLFGFEFLLLPIRLALPFIKYLINLFEILTYSQFDSKQTLFAALEVISTIVKLFVQLLLVRYVWKTQGFLLYLFVEAFENVCAMVKQCKAFYSQVKLINMIERIQDAQQVEKEDTTCLICLHVIENGKRLSCGHIFHKSCLKSWIQSNPNLFCPKCKKPIQLDEPYEQEVMTLKKQLTHSELIEMKTNIQLLNYVMKFRMIQNQFVNSDGIGAVQYGLPCEAVYQTTPITEIRRLQVNQMNSILLGIKNGQIDDS